MSEPLAEYLSRFTPDATGLDRDTLLFAAGRASARASRKWQVVVGALALSQVLTLVLLWPRTSPSPSAAPLVASNPSRPDAVPVPEPDPSEWRVLHQRMFEEDFDKLSPPSAEPMVSPDPPLHVFGPPPPYLLN